MLAARSISDVFSVQEKPPDLGGGAPGHGADCGFILTAGIYPQLCPPSPLRGPSSPFQWTFELGLVLSPSPGKRKQRKGLEGLRWREEGDWLQVMGENR